MSPCRQYGRCVLDEHIAGEANAERPKKPEAKCIEGGAGRARTEIAGRAAARSHVYFRLASERPPVFPTAKKPDASAGVATMKRVLTTLATPRSLH